MWELIATVPLFQPSTVGPNERRSSVRDELCDPDEDSPPHTHSAQYEYHERARREEVRTLAAAPVVRRVHGSQTTDVGETHTGEVESREWELYPGPGGTA